MLISWKNKCQKKRSAKEAAEGKVCIASNDSNVGPFERGMTPLHEHIKVAALSEQARSALERDETGIAYGFESRVTDELAV